MMGHNYRVLPNDDASLYRKRYSKHKDYYALIFVGTESAPIFAVQGIFPLVTPNVRTTIFRVPGKRQRADVGPLRQKQHDREAQGSLEHEQMALQRGTTYDGVKGLLGDCGENVDKMLFYAQTLKGMENRTATRRYGIQKCPQKSSCCGLIAIRATPNLFSLECVS